MTAEEREYGQDPDGIRENAICARARQCGELPDFGDTEADTEEDTAPHAPNIWCECQRCQDAADAAEIRAERP
jgi:hypothetical protein